MRLGVIRRGEVFRGKFWRGGGGERFMPDRCDQLAQGADEALVFLGRNVHLVEFVERRWNLRAVQQQRGAENFSGVGSIRPRGGHEGQRTRQVAGAIGGFHFA